MNVEYLAAPGEAPWVKWLIVRLLQPRPGPLEVKAALESNSLRLGGLVSFLDIKPRLIDHGSHQLDLAMLSIVLMLLGVARRRDRLHRPNRPNCLALTPDV